MSFKALMADFGHGVTSVFKGKPDKDNIYKKDGRVPFGQALAFGIQHIFAMFIANVAPILIVFGFIGLTGNGIPAEYADFASNAVRGCIFIAGVGTIIQLLIGARLPIVIGTSFTFVGLFQSFYHGKPFTFTPGATVEAYYTIMACIIIGGLFIALIGPLVKYWSKLLKPIVPAIVVLGIGLSLLSVGASYFLGEEFTVIKDSITTPGALELVPNYVYYIVVAGVTLLVSLIWNLCAKGVWKNLNIIVAMVVGYLLALIFNFTVCPGIIPVDWGTKFAVDSVGDVINVPIPIDFTQLVFKPVPIIMTCIIFAVASVEGIGDSSAVCEGGLGRKITPRELGGVLTVDGLSSFLAGIFGSLPLTTFSQNVGIVSQTKMVNRFTIFIGACFLVLCGFFPMLANLLLTIPYCVLGGAIIIVFGSIAVTGIKMITKVGLDEKNTLILSLSICLGFGITLMSRFMSALNTAGLQNVATIISNPVLNMFLISVVLSWILPKDMDFSFKKKKKVITENVISETTITEIKAEDVEEKTGRNIVLTVKKHDEKSLPSEINIAEKTTHEDLKTMISLCVSEEIEKFNNSKNK